VASRKFFPLKIGFPPSAIAGVLHIRGWWIFS
jgi:hypothetical protein